MREIRRILDEVAGLEVLSLDDAGIDHAPEEERLEPYPSFEENALSKARHFHELSGLATVADDSGIQVDALGGAPGVRSKRFASDSGVAPADLEGRDLDDANNRHLVSSLRDVDPADRTARYVCVAVLLDEGRPALTLRGEAPGVIVDEAHGSAGFGYDPHMYDPALGKTFAEMTPREKDRRSHRGHAFRALAVELRARLDGPGSRHGGSDPGVPSP